MFAMLRAPRSAFSSRPQLITLSQRGVKRTQITPKPNLYPLKYNEDGSVRRIEKIPGFGPDEVDRFNKWLQNKAIQVGKTLGSSGGRFAEVMNREVEQLIQTDWGIKMSLFKADSRRKRAIRVKSRKNKKMRKRLDDWNHLEDLRENKILRDQQREAGLARRELFSWPAFLRQDREKKRTPYVIEDEETFRKRLEEDQLRYLFNGPRILRSRRTKRSGFTPNAAVEHQLFLDHYEPWEYELRRRGRITALVEEREDAIARAKWIKENDERRAKRLQERKESFMRQLVHWNSTMGRWHKENNDLRMAKQDYMKQREEMYSESRKEFLQALSEEHELWRDSPDECRFLRFRFAENVTFPYNQTAYI